MEERLTKDRSIKLVAIDPLLLAIQVKDANDYAPMMKALSPLRDLARKLEVAILCVHHSKKSISSDAGDNVLGSTALRGSADATWQVIKMPDGTRTFQAEMRYGIDLPPTALVFDEDERTSKLGVAEGAVEKHKAAEVRSRIEQDIINATTAAPMNTKDEILDPVTGNATVKIQVFAKLERDGVLVKSGAGVKGNPFRYIISVPTEAEQN